MINRLEPLLYRVEKPARYIGEEMNMAKKEITPDLVRYGFAFPDVYEVGMSHLGMHILYQLKNEQEDLFCERVFTPWPDMEALMRENHIPLHTLETFTPVKELDFLGFTLQYELSYTNILNMLDLGGIPILSEERTHEDPIILAGGPCAYNPEPLADMIDLFIIGEGEEVNLEVLRLFKSFGKSKRREFLKAASQIKGVYVPSLYEVSYNEDGTISAFTPKEADVPQTIQKRILPVFNEAFFPTNFLVPNIDTVHDRAIIEIFRGCTRGCRFCQAGMLYRPIRERSVDNIVDIVDKTMKSTGFEEMSLASLSTLDYSKIEELVKKLVEKYEDQRIGVSLPSLRLDSFSIDILTEIQKVRKTGLTFAPEAGTQRLRDVINKGVTEEDLTAAMEQVFSLGWNKVKLYFMMGLPTETMEDLEGINDLAEKVCYLHKTTPLEQRMDGLTVTVSTSCFVPKPFTPFQWFPQDTMEVFEEKQQHLKKVIRNRKVKFNYHEAKSSVVEAVFARGDRRVGKALIEAYKNGAKFDGWIEYFNYEKWMEAFEATGISVDFYAHRERSFDEILPWDHIDCGVTKEFLIREYKDSLEGKVTHDCRDGCTACGVNTGLIGGLC